MSSQHRSPDARGIAIEVPARLRCDLQAGRFVWRVSSAAVAAIQSITWNLLAIAATVCSIFGANGTRAGEASLTPIQYRNPSLTVDLGVGLWAWPLPVDFDDDGDLDLVVVCPDKPYNGAYLFENPSDQKAAGGRFPVFKAPVRISSGLQNVRVSYVNGRPRVLTPGSEWPRFREKGLVDGVKIHATPNVHPNRVRANEWHYADCDSDGRTDLVVGVGDWTDYGWDNAFDNLGRWTRGPLRGFVYWMRNEGTDESPKYAPAEKFRAGGGELEVFGMPSPCLADYDGDGDLDLICGEFLDGFTYFRNESRREDRRAGVAPSFAHGVRLTHGGRPLAMDLQMITPTPIDWDSDGDVDLVVGDEDGRVALVENTGKLVEETPQFSPPRYFQQQAADVKFGALATPVSFDWDGDGDEDLISGNTAGHIGFIENLDGGDPPRWDAPKLLTEQTADGVERTIRFQAGPNGSIQGPAEAKWGYTTLSIADWDGDQLPDLIVNSIWGRIVWHRNLGTRNEPRLSAARPVRVAWNGEPPKPAWTWWTPESTELATQWRTTPVALDWTEDGRTDLVMLDHEGYLSLFEQQAHTDGQEPTLLPGRRVFVEPSGKPLRLNDGIAGKSGRRKLCIVDWDGDGRRDLLVNGANADWYRNETSQDGLWTFRPMGPLDQRQLAGHSTSPTVVDWNRDGVPDLLVGAEDGRLYFKRNPHSDR